MAKAEYEYVRLSVTLSIVAKPWHTSYRNVSEQLNRKRPDIGTRFYNF